jgi:hypothetical protein
MRLQYLTSKSQVNVVRVDAMQKISLSHAFASGKDDENGEEITTCRNDTFLEGKLPTTIIFIRINHEKRKRNIIQSFSTVCCSRRYREKRDFTYSVLSNFENRY